MSAATSLAGSPPSLSGHISPSPPRDPLASGLRTLFDPTIRQTTEKLWTVHQSQIALAEELERLISQLNHYLETTDPPALKPTIIKLASVGKRLNAVNTQLHQIQARVNRLFIQLGKMKAASLSAAAAAATATPKPAATPGSAIGGGAGAGGATNATASTAVRGTTTSSPAAAALAAAVASSSSPGRSTGPT